MRQVKLVLVPGEDDDLIAFLSHVPARRLAAAVKTAMRSGQLNAVPDRGDDDDILNALDELLI